MTKNFILVIPSASHNSSAPLPLGCLFLAESLLRNGFSVEIIDNTVKDALSRIEKVAGSDSIAFGISSLSGTQLQNAVVLAKELKRLYPAMPVIFGGAHATAVPAQTLESEFVDFVVYGEGESSLPLLLNAIKNKGDFSKIDGIGFKINKKPVITKKGSYTPLNRKFILPYHLLDMEKYARSMAIGMNRNYYIMSSRGCPFKCKFCSNSSAVWPNTMMRYHIVDDIIDNILVLERRYHCDGITFGDENFFVDKNRVIEVCRALIKNNLNRRLKFRAAGRADILCVYDHAVWELLREAGFVAIGIGAESGSQRILDLIGKKITIEQIHRVDELMGVYGFYKTYNFMTCLPGETIYDFKETLRLIAYLARTSKGSPYPFSTLHKYIPLPGTELFDRVICNFEFTPPADIGGWGKFDLESLIENIKTVRPWLADEFIEYMVKADILIKDLNSMYVGSRADHLMIDNKIDEIEHFILAN